MSGEPAAQRLVVVLHQQPGQYRSEDNRQQGKTPMVEDRLHRKEIAIEAQAEEEQTHERIVDGIEWIAEIAQPTTNATSTL